MISFNTYLDFFNNRYPVALLLGILFFASAFPCRTHPTLLLGYSSIESSDFIGAVDEFHLTFGVIADTGKAAVVLGNIDGGLHPGG